MHALVVPCIKEKRTTKVNWFVPGRNWDLAMLPPNPMLRGVKWFFPDGLRHLTCQA